MPIKGFPPSHKATADAGKKGGVPSSPEATPLQVPAVIGSRAKIKKSVYVQYRTEINMPAGALLRRAVVGLLDSAYFSHAGVSGSEALKASSKLC